MDTDFPDYIALTDSCPDFYIMVILHVYLNVLQSGTVRTLVPAKVGSLEDISDLIEDGKELAGDVTSGNINQMCATKTYFQGDEAMENMDLMVDQKIILDL